jgi:hypothetical protein
VVPNFPRFQFGLKWVAIGRCWSPERLLKFRIDQNGDDEVVIRLRSRIEEAGSGGSGCVEWVPSSCFSPQEANWLAGNVLSCATNASRLLVLLVSVAGCGTLEHLCFTGRCWQFAKE